MSVHWLRLPDSRRKTDYRDASTAPSSNVLACWILSGTKVYNPSAPHFYHTYSLISITYSFRLFSQRLNLHQKTLFSLLHILIVRERSLVGWRECQLTDEAYRSLIHCLRFQTLQLLTKKSSKNGTASTATFAELFVSESPKRNPKSHLSFRSSS